MIISNRTVYTIKLIDELGDCYHEEDIQGYAERQKCIKNWLGSSGYSRLAKGDVTVIIKTSGEELWFYETEIQRGLG